MREKFELWEIVESQILEEGNRTFLIDEPGKTTTLSEFWTLSGRVYGFLKRKGITYEDVVMFCLPRSSAIFAAMLGTLRAGAAFVCTEAGFSSKRTDYIRRDCNYRFYVDENVWQQILETEALDGAEPVDLHDKAFLAYTSGTTGNSKGVIHEYGTITLLNGKAIIRDSILPIIPPFDFISASILLFKALYYHSTLAVVPMQYKKDCNLLFTYMEAVGITEAYLSPSFLRMHGIPNIGLKQVIMSSESADGLMIEGIDNYNLYASTEGGCTISTYHITEPLSPMPIGKGVLNMKVMRQDGKEADFGEKGELCFQQPYFRGYLNLPQKTAEAIRDGWVHSGDQAICLPDGNMAITGRINEQFKIGGYVICPEDIQNALRSALGIKNSIVRGFVFKDLNSICAFYTDPVDIDQAEAEKALLKYIPQYMIPTSYYRLDSFPMLPTGKKDKRALTPPEGNWSQFFDEAICGTEIVGSGRSGTVYSFGASKVVKIFDKDYPLSLIVHEQKKAQAAYTLGVPSPKTFGIVRTGESYGIMFESYSECKTFEEALEYDFGSYKSLIREFIKGVRHLHTIPVSGGILSDVREPLYQYADKVSAIYESEQIEMILSILRHIPDRNTFLQFDCHIDNCFVTDNGPVFFDFIFGGYGHAIFDLYAMYSHLVFWPSVDKKGKLTVEQCREVFDFYLSEYLGTDNRQHLSDAEHQLKCIRTALFLLTSPQMPGQFSEELLNGILSELKDDSEWFCKQVVIG